MPRKEGVYRSIHRYTVSCLCVDLKTGETFIDDFESPVIKDKFALLKYLEKEYDNKKMRIVKIKKVVEKENKYFLSIDKYIKYADIINGGNEKCQKTK